MESPERFLSRPTASTMVSQGQGMSMGRPNFSTVVRICPTTSGGVTPRATPSWAAQLIPAATPCPWVQTW